MWTRGWVIALLAAALPVHGDDFSNDDLCRAIGETRESALQPRDRLFFEKHCSCFGNLGCAETGSARAAQMQRTQAALEAERRADMERKAATEAAGRVEVGRKAAARKAAALEEKKAQLARTRAEAAEVCKPYLDCMSGGGADCGMAWETCYGVCAKAPDGIEVCDKAWATRK
jgi:hypothetical protein